MIALHGCDTMLKLIECATLDCLACLWRPKVLLCTHLASSFSCCSSNRVIISPRFWSDPHVRFRTGCDRYNYVPCIDLAAFRVSTLGSLSKSRSFCSCQRGGVVHRACLLPRFRRKTWTNLRTPVKHSPVPIKVLSHKITLSRRNHHLRFSLKDFRMLLRI